MEWISVKDRLPELNIKILTWNKERRAVIQAIYLGENTKARKWACMGGYTGKITHWMPLPGPPKEEQDGKQSRYTVT